MNILAGRSCSMPYHLDRPRRAILAGTMFLIAHACYGGDTQLYYGPLTHHGSSTPLDLRRSTDIVGNTRAVTTLSGTGLESWSYSPFGIHTIRDAMGNEIVESTYGVTLGFGSRPLVKYLNTLDFHHRLYNERDGAFLTRDPLHYIDTHNERQYAMHNPIDFSDYHGLMSQGEQTTAQGAGTGAPVIPPTGNPTGNGEKPNGPNICVNGGAPANNLPWIMQNVQLQSPGEYEKRLREKLDELIKQHGEDIITAHESGALVPWARPPEYVIWLLNGDRPAFQAAISTQSQADLAKALINGRKPKPYEPGGWAFNALGPNGAAYELIAVFAGVTAAPRVFRGSTAPTQTQMPTALIPRSPRIRPATAAHTPSNAAHDPIFHGPKPSLTIANAAGGSQRPLREISVETTPSQYRIVELYRGRPLYVSSANVENRTLRITLNLTMRGYPRSSMRGHREYERILRHFEGQFDHIRDVWAFGTNLQTVNSLTNQGKPLAGAIGHTWSAQQATRHGYSAFEVISAVGRPGQYEAIVVVFYRPGNANH